MASAGGGGESDGGQPRVFQPGQRVRLNLPTGQSMVFTVPPGRSVRVAAVRSGGQQAHNVDPVHTALQQQQEAAQREAERVHRQLQASLALSAAPEVTFSQEEGRVELSWQPVDAPEAEYVVRMSSDAGQELEVYRGHVTSCCLSPDLLPGHKYTFAVNASSSGETGAPSPGADVNVPALPPSPPPRPKVSVKTKGSLTLRWNAANANGSPITLYSLEWDQSCQQWEELYCDKGKQFKFAHRFPPAVSAHFRVRACNSVGWGGFSDVLEFVSSAGPPAAPLPPSLLTAHPHSLTLHWAPPPVDHGSPVTSYHLDMESPGTGYGFRPAYCGEALSHTLSGLQRCTSYGFRLAASNDKGQGAYSAVVTMATTAELPGAVSLPSLWQRATPTTLSISWAEPADSGGLPLSAYVLQLDTGTGELVDAYTGLEAKFLATELQPGREYQCQVCAVSSVGRGVWSPVACFRTAAMKPHPPPSLAVVGRASQSSVQLKWAPPLNDGGAHVSSYYIEARDGGAGGWAVLASGCPHTRHALTHLAPGTSYQFRVSACNSVGASEPSAVCECVTACAAPDPPQSLSLGLSGSSVTLHWQDSVTHGTTVRSYEVESWAGGGEKRVTSSTPLTTLTLHNLAPASHYQARVRALSSAGDSEWTWPITFSTAPSHPSPPSHITVVSCAVHSLLISWDAPNCNGAPLTAYHIQVSSHVTGHVTNHVTSAAETQYTVSDLQPKTAYRLRVCAENSVGRGNHSNYCSATTLPSPPSPPHLTLTSSSAHNLRLSWAKKTVHGIEYLLQMKALGKEFCQLYRGSAASYRAAKLSPASSYCFRIAAISESGQGVWSDHVTFETTPPPPVAPGGLECERLPDEALLISWNAVPFPLPLSYELQLRLAGDFEQVYRGSDTSFTVAMATDCDVTPQCRVRALACCHANDRDEQLWSAYSEVCVCAKGEPPPAVLPSEQQAAPPPSPEPVARPLPPALKGWLLLALCALLSLLLAVLAGAYLV